MPYPHRASSPPSTKKSRAMPVCVSESVAGFVKMRAFGSARPCADSVRPLSCILARRACSVGFASCLVNRLGCHIVWQLSAADFKHPCLKLWASTITHPCVCGRWGRCIVQRLCATAIVHPLHVYERSVGFASCLVSRLGCHIVWQLSAAAFKHPCLKLWAFIL